MKELIIWLLVLLGVGGSAYYANKDSKPKVTKGKETTDCVIIPNHPDCRK